MQRAIILLLTLTCGTLFGQTKDNVGVIHKQKKYFLSKTCYDYLKWDEVILKNASVANAVNSVIRTAVNSYKLTDGDADSRCNRTMEYETNFKIVYSKNNLISYYLTSYTYFKNAANGMRNFSTLNFNSATGKKINFNNFINPKQISSVDTFIVQKLRKDLGVSEVEYLDIYKNQLSDLAFTINDSGILILFKGHNFSTSIVEILLSYKELEPFVAKDGFLKIHYSK